MPTQTFPLAVVLTITTKRLCCPIGDVYTILNHMTGDNLYTHQIPRAMDECRPWLLRQFPVLGTVDAAALAQLDRFLALWPTDGAPFAVQTWLVTLYEAGLPESYAVSPIPADDHERKDFVAELEAMVGKDRVIVVNVDEENENAPR